LSNDVLLMFFLSSFINFCLASNLLWSFFAFFNFLAFCPFPWQRQPFWKNQPLTAQLHMAYDIPTRSPWLLSSDVLIFYVSFSLLLLLLLLLFHTFMSALFLGDALIKLYKTL
jgi:hypothetical protein